MYPQILTYFLAQRRYTITYVFQKQKLSQCIKNLKRNKRRFWRRVGESKNRSLKVSRKLRSTTSLFFLLQFLLLIVTHILKNLRGDIYHLCSSLIRSVPSFPLLLFPFSLKNSLEHFSYRKYVVLLSFPSSENWLYFAFIPEFILSRYSYFLSAL